MSKASWVVWLPFLEASANGDDGGVACTTGLGDMEGDPFEGCLGIVSAGEDRPLVLGDEPGVLLGVLLGDPSNKCLACSCSSYIASSS
jgi:hypothetical protein